MKRAEERISELTPLANEYTILELILPMFCKNRLEKKQKVDLSKSLVAHLHLEETIKSKLRRENNILDSKLNKLLQNKDQKYEGTDPFTDAENYHKEDEMKKRKIKEVKTGKYVQDIKKQLSKGFDPFLSFGPGINEYFKTMKRLYILFGVLSIVLIPTMYLYSDGGAFDDI